MIRDKEKEKEKEKEKYEHDYSRRDFMKTSALLVGGVSALSACNQESEQDKDISKEPDKETSGGLALKVTGYNFPRLAALANGKVKKPGPQPISATVLCRLISLRVKIRKVSSLLARSGSSRRWLSSWALIP